MGDRKQPTPVPTNQVRPAPPPAPPLPLNWFAPTRQAWIREALMVYGFVNREHLMRKFGISRPQASADLQLFQRDNPKAMTYDLSRKCYVNAEWSR